MNINDKKQRQNEASKRYYARHREERLLYGREHKEQHRLVSRRWAEKHRAERRVYYLKYKEGIKLAVLSHYSKSAIPRCIVCGIVDIDVLCLDHINNDSLARGHRGKGGINFYTRLMNDSYPDGYQTLCANCNLKKELTRRRSCVSY